MTTVFEALGVSEPTEEQTKGMGTIGMKHFMQKEYTHSDEVLDMIKLMGSEPTDENKRLVAASIALGASVNDLSFKLKRLLDDRDNW